MYFQSSKVVDGFSTCFRQWRATDTHCRFLHGYDISFKLTFVGPLDHRHWVQDFGFLKRSKTQMRLSNGQEGSIGDWFKDTFDHTTVIAADDPLLLEFQLLQDKGALQLRVLPAVGCERFAEYVFRALEEFLVREGSEVRIHQVDCREHDKNSASCVSS